MAVHVLMLSAYDALSHIYGRKDMVDALSDHTFAVHTLPPRYFSWRFRGNPLTWSGIDFTVDVPPLDLTSQLVISTNEHDFQGISILEAMACECRPLVSNRLAYPEFLESQHRYSSHEEHPIEANSAVMLLNRWIDELPPKQVPDDLRWQRLESCYVDAFAKSI